MIGGLQCYYINKRTTVFNGLTIPECNQPFTKHPVDMNFTLLHQ